MSTIAQMEKAAELARARLSPPPAPVAKAETAPASTTVVINIVDAAGVDALRRALSPAPVAKKLDARDRAVRLLKAEASPAAPAAAALPERYVFGVVLVPDDVDSQGDIYDAVEVRKAAYSFMEHYGGNLGLMHKKGTDGKTILLDEKVKVLETYVAKQAETYGGELFPAGTWFLGVRIVDDDLWTRVEKGELTGYSIGGTALKEPVAQPASGSEQTT